MILFQKMHVQVTHSLNAELGQFETESPKTYADALTTSHASKIQARLLVQVKCI